MEGTISGRGISGESMFSRERLWSILSKVAESSSKMKLGNVDVFFKQQVFGSVTRLERF